MPKPFGTRRGSLSEKIDSVINRPEFWDPEVSKSQHFIVIAVAGYDKEGPTYCVVKIDIDREHTRFAYPENDCINPTTKLGVTNSFILSGHEKLLDRSNTAGTPENRRLLQLIPDAKAKLRTFFPDAPEFAQAAIGFGIAYITMQGEFDPENIGGTIRVGVLIKNKEPFVHPPFNFASARAPENKAHK